MAREENTDGDATKQKRLAEALRANLRRRKAQSRARNAAVANEGETTRRADHYADRPTDAGDAAHRSTE